jgi:hypothetical protein
LGYFGDSLLAKQYATIYFVALLMKEITIHGETRRVFGGMLFR